MRYLKWVSVLTILAMLFAMLPATVAEEEIVLDPVEVDGEGLEIEVEDVEVLNAIDDSGLTLEAGDIELIDLEDGLLTAETGEPAEASAVSNADGDFEIDEYGTLTRYSGFDKNVVIPDGVKSISHAFEGYTDLESVSIPSSVTSIGDGAFRGCTALKSITLPDSVTYIGWAFSECTALGSVKLSSALETIDWNAFSGCTSLKSIEIPDSVTRIDSGAFSGCTSLTSIKLPNSMTELSGGLFSHCDSLDNLDFLSGVTKIDGSLFSYCDGLKSITIPGSVTSIGSGVFSNCKNLESVTIHSGVTFIDRTAFDGSDNVTIRGTAGSYAETYANGMGIPFNAPVISFNEEMLHNWEDDSYYIILYINHNRTLNAVQKPADLARTLSWSSSDTNVVTVDQNGTIKGIAKGTATITAATADGKGKAAQIKVVVPEPTSIELSYNYWSDNKTITLSQTSSISASTDTPYQYATGVEMPITWSSSDASIISVETSKAYEATLKGNKLGKATITATTPDGGKASIELEVIRPAVSGIKIDQSSPLTLHPGDQTRLTATLFPEGAESALTWVSSNVSVARVANDGTVTAVAEGYARIWVETTNGYRCEIEVYIIPLHPHPEAISIDQVGPIQLYAGQQCVLTASMLPADAEAALTWGSRNDNVATVSQDGVVTAVNAGYAEIYVETDNGRGASVGIQVLPALKKIKLSKKKATLGVKEKLTLTVTFKPADAETPLTWESSKPKVATVSADGKVTAKKKGTTVITVTAANGKTAKATITVKAAPKKVTLNKSGTVTLAKGKKLKLKAKLPKNTASALTWKSSKPGVASVDQKGVVTALKKGAAVITVKTFNGKTAKVTIKVK